MENNTSSFSELVDYFKESKARDVLRLGLESAQAKYAREIAGEDDDKRELQLDTINFTLLENKAVLENIRTSLASAVGGGFGGRSAVSDVNFIEPSRNLISYQTPLLSGIGQDVDTLSEERVNEGYRRREEFKQKSTGSQAADTLLDIQRKQLQTLIDHKRLFNSFYVNYIDNSEKLFKKLDDLTLTIDELKSGFGNGFGGFGIPGRGGGKGGERTPPATPGAGKPKPGKTTKVPLGQRLAKSPLAAKLGGGVLTVATGAYVGKQLFNNAEGNRLQATEAVNEALKAGTLTEDEAKEALAAIELEADKRKSAAVGEGSGIIAGAIAGGSVGATVGTAIFPGVGTVPGAIVGGVVGSIAGSEVGREVGEFVGENIINPVKTYIEKNKTPTVSGTLKETPQGKFSEKIFSEKNKLGYERFKQFKQRQSQEIYREKVSKLTDEEKKDPNTKKRIMDEVNTEAELRAVERFKPMIESSGALNPQEVSEQDRKLLDFIAQKESGGDYDVVYGKGKVDKLTDMTVKEVMDYQKQLTDSGQKSSAAGKYQFIRSTLAEEASAAGIDVEKEKFTAELQDKLILNRLKRVRGLEDFRSGKISEIQFAENLSKEFASLPSPLRGGGKSSYYEGIAGNKALVSMQDVYAQLNAAPSITTPTQMARADIERSQTAIKDTIENRDLQRSMAAAPQASIQPVIMNRSVTNNNSNFVAIKGDVRPDNKGSALVRFQDRTHVY